jgi:hypothetical protein
VKDEVVVEAAVEGDSRMGRVKNEMVRVGRGMGEVEVINVDNSQPEALKPEPKEAVEEPVPKEATPTTHPPTNRSSQSRAPVRSARS